MLSFAVASFVQQPSVLVVCYFRSALNELSLPLLTAQWRVSLERTTKFPAPVHADHVKSASTRTRQSALIARNVLPAKPPIQLVQCHCRTVSTNCRLNKVSAAVVTHSCQHYNCVSLFVIAILYLLQKSY